MGKEGLIIQKNEGSHRKGGTPPHGREDGILSPLNHVFYVNPVGQVDAAGETPTIDGEPGGDRTLH